MTLEPIAETRPQAATAREPWPSPRVAWYAVFVFSLTLTINFLDRGIIQLLVPGIKADLHLSDFQMSLVIGFAFVLFYLFMGLPVARLADTHSRRTIIGIGIATWSAATALCGLAQNFWQLFVWRVVTGAGESCNGPATYSLLADLFPPEKLTRAIAVLNFGFMFGSAFALIIGGALIHFLEGMPPPHLPLVGTLHVWQMAFIVTGLPGLVVAGIVWTVKEPLRRGRLMVASGKTQRAKTLPVSEVVRFVFANRAVYLPMFIGLGFSTALSFGTRAWMPTFYDRTFGWHISTVGMITGFLFLLVWPPGAMFGSWLAERWQKKGHDDANLRVTVWALLLLIPGEVLLPLMPRPEYSLAISVVDGFIAAWLLGPQNAALQVITPNEMRAQISALAILIFNVVGFGIGPTFVASLTDFVFHDEHALRYALSLAALILSPLAALSIWWGMKPYGAAYARAREQWS
jgi:MFS family permease